MSDEEQNETVVRACFARASQGDFEALHDILDDDYVIHPEEAAGVDGLTELVEGYRSAIGGLTVTIDQQFSAGDYVATRYTISGTHAGELMGKEPTGKEVAFSGITVSRCRAGRIAEEWELTDTVGLLRQIGALPEPASR